VINAPTISVMKGKQMKPHKSTVLIVLLGLFLAAFAVGLAQTSSQKKHAKHTEESCSMDSCCCKGDSCPIKEGTTNAAAKQDGCCCCEGDSCEMKGESMKNHAADESCCCRNGDSSELEMKETMKEKMKEKMKNHSASDECCCNMKEKHKDSKHQMKQKAA
jgi:hypothetical protein